MFVFSIQVRVSPYIPKRGRDTGSSGSSSISITSEPGAGSTPAGRSSEEADGTSFPDTSAESFASVADSSGAVGAEVVRSSFPKPPIDLL